MCIATGKDTEKRHLIDTMLLLKASRFSGRSLLLFKQQFHVPRLKDI